MFVFSQIYLSVLISKNSKFLTWRRRSWRQVRTGRNFFLWKNFIIFGIQHVLCVNRSNSYQSLCFVKPNIYLDFLLEEVGSSISNTALPTFLSRPAFVVGMPVLRANFCLAAVIPSARFQLNDNPGIPVLLPLFFDAIFASLFKFEISKPRKPPLRDGSR